jgi:hypothetical protein
MIEIETVLEAIRSFDEQRAMNKLTNAIDGISSVLELGCSPMVSQELTEVFNGIINIMDGVSSIDDLSEYIDRLEILNNEYLDEEEEDV